METISHSMERYDIILALGAESAGNFAIFQERKLFRSEDFGDLSEPENFSRFQKSVLAFLKKEKIKPDVIITDLHPLYVTTVWGKGLAKKFKARHVEIQHHMAHIFSQLGENVGISNFQFPISNKISNSKNKNLNRFYGVALDGTGYGLDGKIWGGEVFKISNEIQKSKLQIQRIGHLENQILIGGEIAIREPARMLIGILSKFLDKKEVYAHVKKYYSKNQFELIWNQLQQNFNCLETSSTGRILDAVSVLLGFAKNERKEKHEATFALEDNSSKPYLDIKPKIETIGSTSMSNFQFPISNKFPMIKFSKKYHVLNTTHLFSYLIKNLHKDKKRLAATTQLYIAEGLHEVIKTHGTWNMEHGTKNIILSGGISNNKIISNYFESKGILQNKKSRITRGDAGLPIGQLNYFLLADPRD